jgi:1-phosphofructokinase
MHDAMIYTVTLNPSLDYVMQVDSFVPDAVNRAKAEFIYPGGKGVNVSIILQRLGFKTTALGFCAGFTGIAFKSLLRGHISAFNFMELPAGNTRINVKIKSGKETDVNGQGPAIPEKYFDSFLNLLDALKADDVLVLAGAVPKNLPDDAYERILKRVAAKKPLIAVDATGELLKRTLRFKPFLIKPNIHELGELFGRTLSAAEDVIDAAKAAQKNGARNVVVSMAEKGALLLSENGEIISCPPLKTGRALNSVGAGDSMVAGFLAGWLGTKNHKKALELGGACGTATAYCQWLAEKKDIAALLQEPDWRFESFDV